MMPGSMPASGSVTGGAATVGAEMYAMIAELYPICRSITGDGVRQTLRSVARHIPIVVHEVPTGTPVLDWTVPNEWNIRDAYVKNAQGERVIDFQKSNLHVMGYSVPVRRRVSLEELRQHVFTLPEHPDWIPYRTSYYNENWAFCAAHRTMASLPDGEYDVCIDATLAPGSLTYGELLVEGQRTDEVLISAHICHPSLCNDNLSAVAVATFLARTLLTRTERPRYSYRIVFAPGTIGAITWLHGHPDAARRIKHGLVSTCLGDPGAFTYKKSRRGNATIDSAVPHVLRHSGHRYQVIEYSPSGYDERQYCSPGFNLPVGRLSRSSQGQFPEYHTSADDLSLVRPEALAESLAVYTAIVDLLEYNRVFVNTHPFGEPQLGRRGLYAAIGGAMNRDLAQQAMLWVLNQSDGTHSLLEIAERSELPFAAVRDAAMTLTKHGLLREQDGQAGEVPPAGSRAAAGVAGC
jgi:aminopeptidase-like protein